MMEPPGGEQPDGGGHISLHGGIRRGRRSTAEAGAPRRRRSLSRRVSDERRVATALLTNLGHAEVVGGGAGGGGSAIDIRIPKCYFFSMLLENSQERR